MEVQINRVDISIIVVNYQSWKHLKSCLSSLGFQSKSYVHEVIVIDNHSNDGELEHFQAKFPDVQFVENSGNNGFANGCNLGAARAQGNYFLFLNPDAIANEEAVFQMWQFYKKNPGSGIVSCHQKKSNGTYEKSLRIFPNVLTLFGFTRAVYKAISKKNLHHYFEIRDDVLYPDWVSGSVVFMSKEWFEALNGWSEDYWMYYEDMDLCKRVKTSNGKIALLKSAEIIHNHGGASRLNIKTSSLTKTEVHISRHVYVHNHFKEIEKIVTQILLVMNNLITGFILGILGLVLFFIPKMRLNVYLLTKMIRYYVTCLIRFTWLSPRSMNYK